MEIWKYEDGAQPQLIFKYDADAEGFLEGALDINLTLEIEEEIQKE